MFNSCISEDYRHASQYGIQNMFPSLIFENYDFNMGVMMRKRFLDPSGAPGITPGLTQSSFYSGYLF
jgi:hypothetical protein